MGALKVEQLGERSCRHGLLHRGDVTLELPTALRPSASRRDVELGLGGNDFGLNRDVRRPMSASRPLLTEPWEPA